MLQTVEFMRAAIEGAAYFRTKLRGLSASSRWRWWPHLLRREKPAKIAALILGLFLPQLLLALFVDAYPEGGRASASRTFFVST